MTQPIVARFGRNERGRDFAVGDIHGSFSLLERELERIGFDRRCDRLFSAGDLVDRGPESHRAGEFLDRRWFHAVLGNHDASVLCREGEAGRLGDPELVGARAWMADFHDWLDAMKPRERRKLVNRLGGCPWAIEVETECGLVGIAHAEVPEGFDSWQAFAEALRDPYLGVEERYAAIWSRVVNRRARPVGDPDAAEGARLPDLHAAIHGHSPSRDNEIVHLANRYWIDTSAWEAAVRPDLAAGASSPPRFSIVDLRDPGWRL